MMENGYLTQTTEKRLMIVSGQGYPELSERIAERLDIELSGVELRNSPMVSCTPGIWRASGEPTCSSCSRCATLSTRT